jgi:nitrite reductase/ring-hydroxylating ferredoxin subunit
MISRHLRLSASLSRKKERQKAKARERGGEYLAQNNNCPPKHACVAEAARRSSPRYFRAIVRSRTHYFRRSFRPETGQALSRGYLRAIAPSKHENASLFSSSTDHVPPGCSHVAQYFDVARIAKFGTGSATGNYQDLPALPARRGGAGFRTRGFPGGGFKKLGIAP